MTNTSNLLTQARARRFGLWLYLTTWGGVLGAVWLFLEPLGLFGVWKAGFERLGGLGYLILVLASGLLALLGLLVRSALADRRVVSHLLRSASAGVGADFSVLVHQPGPETGRMLHGLVASLTPTPVTQLLWSGGESQVAIAQRASVLGLLRGLGLVSVTGNGLAQPVSETAACFVRSLAESMSEGVTFLGGWDKAGTNNPAAKAPRQLLRQLEERRQLYVPRARLRATRSAQACLAIIKGRLGGEDVYLMQESNAWGEPYYWFIGGVMEEVDRGEPEACLYREIEEELQLARGDILSASLFCEASDLRISARIGALTEYHYRVYFVQLNTSSPAVRPLIQPEFTRVTFEGVAPFERSNRWLTWQELDTASIRRDAPTLIAEILRVGPGSLPTSIGQEITA